MPELSVGIARPGEQEDYSSFKSVGVRSCRRTSIAIVFVGCLAMGQATAQVVNDFPTVARADYVFGCMKVNGETRQALEKCSCSIDVIASLLPYEKYETAAAFMSMGQLPGEKGVIFRQSEPAKQATAELQRARAEAEVRCF